MPVYRIPEHLFKKLKRQLERKEAKVQAWRVRVLAYELYYEVETDKELTGLSEYRVE